MPDPAEAPEFPKVLVRVRHAAGGGYEAEIRVAADDEAVTVATAEGFIVVELPPNPFPAYPKWVYHADGRRQVVQTEAELDTLGDGFEDSPPEGPEEPAPQDYGTPA